MNRRTWVNGRADDGVAAAEFAALMPMILIAALVALPVITRAQDANRLDESLGAALRYATKASANALPVDDDGICAEGRRRRSAPEVAMFLEQASGGIVTASDVHVNVVSQSTGTSTLHPCRGISGSIVTVTASWTLDVGFVGDLANGVSSLVGAPDVVSVATRDLSAFGALE